MTDSFGYSRGNPDINWWLSELRRGKLYRANNAFEADWSRWKGYYRGKWPPGILPVNLFFAMARSLVPRLYFRNPSITVSAGRPTMECMALASIVERVDNNLMRNMRIKNEIKRAIQHAFFRGTGIMKLGFGAEFTPTPQLGVTDEPVSGKGERLEYNTLVKKNFPWAMCAPTGSFIVPAGTVTMDDARWCANWIRRPLSDVQADPRFKNVKDLRPTSGRDHGQQTTRYVVNEAGPDMVDLVEIRDKKFKKVFILAPFATDKLLYIGDDAIQVNDRLGYYRIVFNEDEDCFWGVPDSIILEPQQLELNETRTLQMKHRRMAVWKLLYQSKSIDHVQLERVINGDVMSAIECTDINGVKPLQIADIPQSLLMHDRTIMEDVREMMGFSRNQSGDYATGSADRTKYETQVVEAAGQIRIDERQDMISDMVVDMFEDIHPTIFSQWTQEEVVQVMTPDEQLVWVAYTPTMLSAGSYELNIDPDSYTPETKSVKERKALVLMETLKGNPLIDPILLTKLFLRTMGGLQFDILLKDLTQRASQGVSGSSPTNPMPFGQYMSGLANGGGGQSPIGS